MVGSASPVISLITYGSPWTIFIRQALWMVVGIGALLILARDRLPEVAPSWVRPWWWSRSACWSPSWCPGWG